MYWIIVIIGYAFMGWAMAGSDVLNPTARGVIMGIIGTLICLYAIGNHSIKNKNGGNR